MGLFGSLYTAVSGLNAESQATSIIANNIANTSTIGFKRSEASFSSLVTSQSRLSEYSPGTVSVNRVQRVDEQGPVQQTSSSTDAAISGNGFFVVKRNTASGQEFLYTRSGSFSEDSQGLLRNTAGYVLYGWPIDQNGNLPANQGDLSSLVPVDVAFLGGLTRPTTSAQLAINLDSGATNIQTTNIASADGAGGNTLPLSNTAASFSRGLTVYDSLGDSQTLTMEFRKITGPMANITSRNGVSLSSTDEIEDVLAGINVGDAMNITMNGKTLTLEFVEESGEAATLTAVDADNTVVAVNSVQDMIEAINSMDFGTGSDGLEARLNENGQIVFQARNLTERFSIADRVGTPATGSASTFDFGSPTGAGNTEIEVNPTGYPDPSGYESVYSNQDNYPNIANTSTPNTQGWWEVTILHPNGSKLSQGLLNFDGDGALNASADAEGNIDIDLQNISWGNGSSLQSIAVNVERFSQFSGNFDVISSDQNGAELGLRTGVELSRDGTVIATFSNGATANLYKIPLVTFANPNGLNEVSGTAYSETQASGEENLREAGDGGAGYLEPSTIEGSNVDLADEFSKLIVSQRTFSANTRIVTTVDEMTQELLRIRG